MQKKDDKVGNNTANKQERQREKRERERKIEIDSQKRNKFLLLRMREKQISCLITSDQSKNMPLFLQISFLAIFRLIS